MKIAQVAPLYESVPPKLYGGTERVVSILTEELVSLGHEVVLFASGDSVTNAELVPVCPRSLRLDKNCVDKLAHHFIMLEQVFERRQEFDIIHFHIDYLHFPLSRAYKIPNVSTMHGRLDIPDLVPLFHKYSEMPVVSVSKDQQKPLPWLNWQGVVYHGLPINLYKFHEKRGDYLAFLGRISPEKRVDRAIEIAKRVGMPLKIAAKVDEADKEYYEQVFKPIMHQPLIEFIGEIGDAEKNDFLGNAYALLFPIDWPEPFGLVMIEALACGTPTIVFDKGSASEIIDNGLNGFICENMNEAIQAVKQIHTIERKYCRESFEARFTAQEMAMDYLKIYQKLLSQN